MPESTNTALSLPARPTLARDAGEQRCPLCADTLPLWARYCGSCGLRLHAPTAGGWSQAASVAGSMSRAQGRQPRQAHADFWTFLTGETISNLGGAFTQFALPLLVYHLTRSPVNLGLATAVAILPYLLFGLVIGAWVDRLDRKRLMIAVDLLQAAVIATIPVVFLLGHLTVWWLYGVSFGSATLKIAFECGQFAAMPSLVKQEDLVTANGRLQASFGASQVLGPVLAGALLFLLPLPTLLLVDAASFLVSAGFLTSIRPRFQRAQSPEKRNMRLEVREGLRYVWQHPVLRLLSLFLPLLNLLSITTLSQIVVLATVHFHAPPWQVSVFYSAASAGAVLGSLLAGPLRRQCSFSRLVFGTVAASGLVTVALALAPWYLVAVVLWGLKTSLEAVFNTVYLSARQALVPNHLLGRVMSSSRMLAYASIPPGSLVGGLLLAWVGVDHISQVYLGIGVLVLLLPVAFAGTALGQAERYLPGAPGGAAPGGSNGTV